MILEILYDLIYIELSSNNEPQKHIVIKVIVSSLHDLAFTLFDYSIVSSGSKRFSRLQIYTQSAFDFIFDLLNPLYFNLSVIFPARVNKPSILLLTTTFLCGNYLIFSWMDNSIAYLGREGVSEDMVPNRTQRVFW